MNKRKSIFLLLTALVCSLVIPWQDKGITTVSADDSSGTIQSAGDFYKDVPEAETSYLGASQYFHIFANEVYLKTHTNGNIATRYFKGGVNFGTKNYPEKEYYYLQKIDSIASSSGEAGPVKDKFVVGNKVSVNLNGGNRPSLNGIMMDHFSSDEIYQDEENSQYIDFDKEFLHLEAISRELEEKEADLTVKNSDFSDFNNRVIDVSKINKSNIYIRLDADVLKENTPLTIKGLGLPKNPETAKNIYLTVITDNSTEYQSNSEIRLVYADGTTRNPSESIDFSNSNLIWNFISGKNPYGGKINLEKAWQGTILAPKATLEGGSNIDGSIIVDKFKGGTGETHRWDFTEIYDIQLTKVNGEKTADKLPGAVFNLYNQEGSLIAENLTTDSEGQLLYRNLARGTYYFVETQAPEGYSKDETQRFYFTLPDEAAIGIPNIIVSNKKIEEENNKVNLSLEKIDAFNQTALGRVVFTLTNSNQFEDKQITDEYGKATFTNLEKDTEYSLEETLPLEGYQGLDKVIKIKFNSQTEQWEILNENLNGEAEIKDSLLKVKNYPITRLPETGGRSRGIVFLSSSINFLVVGLLMIIKKKKG